MIKGYSEKQALTNVMVDEFGDDIKLVAGGIYDQAGGMMRMSAKDICDLMCIFNNKFTI